MFSFRSPRGNTHHPASLFNKLLTAAWRESLNLPTRYFVLFFPGAVQVSAMLGGQNESTETLKCGGGNKQRELLRQVATSRSFVAGSGSLRFCPLVALPQLRNSPQHPIVSATLQGQPAWFASPRNAPPVCEAHVNSSSVQHLSSLYNTQVLQIYYISRFPKAPKLTSTGTSLESDKRAVGHMHSRGA